MDWVDWDNSRVKKGQTDRHMYRKAEMKWARCYDGETLAVRKLGVFIINHWARKQVCCKRLTEKQTCKGVLVDCGLFLWSFREPPTLTSVWHCWGFCKRTLRGQETPRGHCMKLWKWRLGCSGDANMLAISDVWDIFQRELYIWRGTRPRETRVLEHSILGWCCCLEEGVMKTLRSRAILEGACHWVWALRVHCLPWFIVCPLCFLYVVEMWFASFLLWPPRLPCHGGLHLVP